MAIGLRMAALQCQTAGLVRSYLPRLPHCPSGLVCGDEVPTNVKREDACCLGRTRELPYLVLMPARSRNYILGLTRPWFPGPPPRRRSFWEYDDQPMRHLEAVSTIRTCTYVLLLPGHSLSLSRISHMDRVVLGHRTPSHTSIPDNNPACDPSQSCSNRQDDGNSKSGHGRSGFPSPELPPSPAPRALFLRIFSIGKPARPGGYGCAKASARDPVQVASGGRRDHGGPSLSPDRFVRY